MFPGDWVINEKINENFHCFHHVKHIENKTYSLKCKGQLIKLKKKNKLNNKHKREKSILTKNNTCVFAILKKHPQIIKLQYIYIVY